MSVAVGTPMVLPLRTRAFWQDPYPMFDTARFARYLESAYATMWERHQRGDAPASFSVAAIR